MKSDESPYFRVCFKCGVEIGGNEWLRTRKCPECGNDSIQMRRKFCVGCGIEVDAFYWVRNQKCDKCGHGLIHSSSKANNDE